MWVCLSDDLCVDLEDTDACVAHARPVSENQAAADQPPERQWRNSAGSRAGRPGGSRTRPAVADTPIDAGSPNAARIVKAGGDRGASSSQIFRSRRRGTAFPPGG